MALSRTAGRPRRGATTRAERRAKGKALRRRVPRSRQGEWSPPKDRADPIALLEASNRSRVARLLPIRYGRMALSPFTFFRGAASIMAADLASTPSTGLRVQLAGDAHVGNFGIFATPERSEVFDVNDFDETLPGPWEWDLKRLGASLVLAARQNRLSRPAARRVVARSARAYRTTLRRLAALPYLDTWYLHLDLSEVHEQLDRRGRGVVKAAFEAARRRTPFHAFPKLAASVHGRYRIRDAPPLLMHYRDPADLASSTQFLERYRATLPEERRMLLDRYRLVDVAQKVVGVGSVGTVCSVMLLLGDADVPDPLFLQVKEAQPSALEPYLGPSRFANHAERVVVGQHLIQEASDIFLGWSSLNGRDFYVRQLRDMKFSTDLATLSVPAMIGQGELCAAALARAHARTGDPATISGYLGTGEAFDGALVRFAEAYADQTERDHAELKRAIRRGRIEAAAKV